MEAPGTTVERLPAGCPPAELAEAMDRDGAVVVTGLLTEAQARAIDTELAPHADRREPGYDTHEEFWGARTKRFQGLPAKSPTYVSHVLLSPTLLGVADAVLRPHCGDYWISQTEAIFIGPGQTAQELHRDDANWSYATPLGHELLFSALVAVGDYDAEVGATMVVPGSHRWPEGRVADPGQARPVELEVGDALVYLGSVHHGGGANRTSDRWRKAVYCGFLLGWLTPEEATALALTPEQVDALPPRARQLLGWTSQHGTPATEGVQGAMQLWQLDRDDCARLAGRFGQ